MRQSPPARKSPTRRGTRYHSCNPRRAAMPEADLVFVAKLESPRLQVAREPPARRDGMTTSLLVEGIAAGPGLAYENTGKVCRSLNNPPGLSALDHRKHAGHIAQEIIVRQGPLLQ